MKTALLFAGQGAQSQGMGKDFLESFDSSKHVFECAEAVSGLPLTKIIADGTSELHQTRVTQPAVAATSAAIFEAVRNNPSLSYDAVLGFSLGEYVALYAAGVYSLDQMLETVVLRARWMDECAVKFPGAMAAVLQADPDKLRHLCAEVTKETGFVAIANHNSPQQLVVSGTIEGIEELTRRIGETNAKRIVRLNTSGGFHTPLMEEAAKKLRTHLESIALSVPNRPVILNATASEYVAGTLPELAMRQTMGPVRFVESIERLIEQGFGRFVEIGPGSVLSGLVKKINPEVLTLSIQTVADLRNLEEIA